VCTHIPSCARSLNLDPGTIRVDDGQSRLCGEQVAVEWLKPDLKQRLRQQLTDPSLQCLQPEGSQVALARDKGLEFQGAWAALQLLCQRMKLGSPLFLTKCLGTGSAGWHRFWYQVVIPGHPVPFSGLIWVVLAPSGQDGHEVAKDAVSARLLEALSLGPASCGLLGLRQEVPWFSSDLILSPGNLNE
ncbi:hypothetical protein E2I00_000269, partial [Balaenoptera physalus]